MESVIRYQQNTKAIEFIRRHTKVPVKVASNLSSLFCMWEGIRLYKGRLEVDPWIAHTGDLLHEAGHLVTMPKELRQIATGELGEFDDFMLKLAEISEENYLYSGRPFSSFGDDDAATYWAFAACRKIGLPDYLPFAKGYGNEARELWHMCRISAGSGLGCRFSTQLFYAGLLASKKEESPIVWDILLLP